MILCASSSCKSGGADPVSPDGKRPIRFRNYDSGWGRALSPLEEMNDNFHVVATKWLPDDPNTQTVMPGYRVDYDGSRWNYENPLLNQYLKYWDESSEHYLFSAVTPAPDNSPTAGEAYRNTTVAIASDGGISIDNAMGNVSTGDYPNSSHSPDWMVAQTERWKVPLVDLDKLDPSVDLHTALNSLQALTDDVPLCFHHIMSLTDILIWSTSPIIIQKLEIEVIDEQPIITRGDWSSDTHWTNLTSRDEDRPMALCEYLYTDGRSVSNDQDRPTLMASHTQIPQQWLASGRQFKATITTTSGVVYQGTFTLNVVTNHTNSWEQNKHYRYIIKINTGDGEAKPVVLFAVDMDTWKWREGSSVEDVQTDW